VTLRDVHVAFAWVVVFANAAVGLWALGAHWWAPLRHRTLWWATAAAEVTVVVQVLLGSLLVTSGHRELPQFHALYGFAAFATVGVIYSYRQQLARHIYLLYGLGGLFLMGLAIRAMVVGTTR
jgi:hypothetical protein